MNQSNISEDLLHIRKRARRRLLGAVALVLFALIVLWTVLDNAPPPQLAEGQPVEIVSSAPALSAARASVVAVVEPASGTSPESLTPAAQPASVPTAMPAATPVAAPEPQLLRSADKASQPYRVAASSSEVLRGKLVNRQMQVKPAVASRPKLVAETKSKTAEVVGPAGADPLNILEGKDERKPATAEKPAGGRYFVQIGAFSDSAKSAQILAKLKSAGLPAFSEKVSTPKGELTRIRIGPTLDESRANEWRKKSESAGVPGKVVR